MSGNLWKNPWLAVFLSELFPGAGQIHVGNKTKGIVFIVIWLLLLITGITCFYIFLSSDEVAVAQLSGLILFMVFVAVLVISIYVLFDAYITAKRHNLHYQLDNKIEIKKNPWLAVFLSYIFPGLGQFYSKQILKGIVFVLLTIFSYVLEGYSYVYFILLIPLYFIALKDAYESAEERNNSNKKFLVGDNKLMKLFVIAMILFNLVPWTEITKKYFLEAFKFPSGSMMPTLIVGDHILVDKTKKAKKSVKREDLIVFRFPKDREEIFVKRIIAVGGDTIESKDKNIYINGVLLEEPYVQHVENNMIPEAINPRDNFGPYVVPKDKIFVMGDNRDQSNDSRYWGYVSKDDILGKVFKIYWSWNSVNNSVRWERVGKAIQN